nr:integrase, catalytic region, zinc finger, CCHC-type, peptidase aspartic, catalytic [Tanacetum cinerariifolium]
MLDAFTSSMCAEPWGRIGFAHALIEIDAGKVLKEETNMAVPKLDEEGHTIEKMQVEYEGKPLQCLECCVFGHSVKECPKHVVEKTQMAMEDDEGFRLKADLNASDKEFAVKLKNHFTMLQDEDKVEPLKEPSTSSNGNFGNKVTELDSESDVEDIGNEFNVVKLKGASTHFIERLWNLRISCRSRGLSNVVYKVFRNWVWASNASVLSKGCRIIIGWNKDVVDVVIDSFSDQAIHTKIIHKADQKFFFCTFIYVGNDPKVRRVLWSDLSYHKVMVHSQPWILLGDFNVALNVEDSLSGSSSMTSAMCDFKDCVEDIEVVLIILWYLDSECSKHMTKDRSHLINFIQKFLGTVKFENDHVSKIMGYGDYKIRNVTILRVYFVEGLGHNLFSVGQFCDSDLEVAFRQHTCFIHNLDGVDLLIGSRGNNLYTLSLKDMMASSPICLLSKASKTKFWLWHRRLSHLNFGAINHLARQGLVRDNGTEFVNQTLREYYEQVGISHETSVARSPQQNGVVKRRNPPIVIASNADVIPPVQAESTGSPSSTTVDQDAPSPSKTQTIQETQSSVIPQDVEEYNHNIEVSHIGNDLLFGVPIPEVTSA